MMRWWDNDVYVRTRTASEDEILRMRIDLIREEDELNAIDAKGLRKHIFRVEAATSHLERVGVTGNCPELGSWQVEQIFLLNREEDSNIWSCEVIITKQRVKYRFVVVTDASYSPENMKKTNVVASVKSVRRWETKKWPRNIDSVAHLQFQTSMRKEYLSMPAEEIRKLWERKRFVPEEEIFGSYRKTEVVSRGWLTFDGALHVKLFKGKLRISDRDRAKLPVYAKLRTFRVRPGGSEVGDYCTDSCDGWPVVEVTVLNENSKLTKRQCESGIRLCGYENVIFQIFYKKPETLGIVIEFFDCVSTSGELLTEEPKLVHWGFASLYPKMMLNSEGEITTGIFNIGGTKLGEIELKYSFITRFSQNGYSLNFTLPSSWKAMWASRSVNICSETRNNNLASAEVTIVEGVNFLEVPLYFTKDAIPVFSHSPYIVVAIKHATDIFPMEQFQVAINNLTVAQLQAMRIVPYYECNNELKVRTRGYPADEQHRPFPNLTQILNGLDNKVGLMIEVNMMPQKEDGTYDKFHEADVNKNVDRLLTILQQTAAKRNIILSSCHPDVCSMMKLKQNMHPVIFLFDGIPSIYPKYDQDERCRSIENAIYFAVSMELQGVGLRERTILDPSTAELLRKEKLVPFCVDGEFSKKMRRYLYGYNLRCIFSYRRDKYGPFKRTYAYFADPDMHYRNALRDWSEEAAKDGYMKPDIFPLELPNRYILELEWKKHLDPLQIPASYPRYLDESPHGTNVTDVRETLSVNTLH